MDKNKCFRIVYDVDGDMNGLFLSRDELMYMILYGSLTPGSVVKSETGQRIVIASGPQCPRCYDTDAQVPSGRTVGGKQRYRCKICKYKYPHIMA